MTHPPSKGLRGFTLLEGVLALAILVAVIIVCLQLRAQIGMVGRQVQKVAARDNATEALFQCLVNGLLHRPTTDPESGAFIWEGEQNGTPFRIVRKPVSVPNPLIGQVNFDVAATVGAYRYDITLGTTKTEFVWHR